MSLESTAKKIQVVEQTSPISNIKRESTEVFNWSAKIKLTGILALGTFFLSLPTHNNVETFSERVARSYSVSLSITFLFCIFIYFGKNRGRFKKFVYGWLGLLIFANLGALLPQEPKAVRAKQPETNHAPSKSNIVEVNQPIAQPSQQAQNLAASERKAQLEKEEYSQKLKAHQTCLSIYHSLEQSIQNGGVMDAAQYAYNVKDQVPIRGINEGCFEIQGVVLSLGDIWKTGEVPSPAEFERIARQLVRAKALLNDPSLKRESFNNF